MEIDILWENHGSLLLMELVTETAQSHWAEFGDPDALQFAGKVVVEPRYAPLLHDQLRDAGLVQR